MTTAIFGSALLRCSTITYRSDVRRMGAVEIPLGIMVDLRVGPRYGIGLRTRRQISDVELATVGGLARASVRSPFALLKCQYDRVRSAADPGTAFAQLPARNATAIWFQEPDVIQRKLPTGLLADPDADELRLWVEDQLAQFLAERFWPFIDGPQARNFEQEYLAA